MSRHKRTRSTYTPDDRGSPLRPPVRQGRTLAREVAGSSVTRVLLCLTLAVVTLAVYEPVRRHGFASLDDTAYVTENSHVAGGVTAGGLAWALTGVSDQAANWHPVTWVSHMVDVQLFGMQAGAHHMVSVALHWLNASVLFLLLRSTTGHTWRSACVAALFAVHPLQVESVAWIAERKNVLSTLFWLLTMWAYVRYVRQPSRTRYGSVLGLFALALMAKPMAVTLPFTLLLLDWWPLNRVVSGAAANSTTVTPIWRRWLPLLVEKWPLFVLSALSSAVTVAAQRHGGAVVALESVPVATRATNAAMSYVTYAWQLVWPSHLSVFYPHEGTGSVAFSLGAAGILFAVTVAAFRLAGRRPHLAVGWLWYLGTLVPVIGLVQVGMQARADRYTYVPAIGLLLVVVWECAERVRSRIWLRQAAAVCAGTLIIAYGIAARAQVEHWTDDATLWGHALNVNPNNYYAHYIIGRTDLQNGRLEEAERHLERAIELAPWFAEVHDTLGLAKARSGQLDAAFAAHLEALRLKPGLLAARFNLGLAYERRGDLTAAIQQYREALRQNPNTAAVHAALGHALAAQGRSDEAMGEFREALRIDPDSAPAHTGFGSVLAERGDVGQAVAALQEALAANPEFVPAHRLLGTLRLQQGNTSEALRHLGEAVSLDPGSVDARAALGAALAGAARLEEAAVQYGEAVRLTPNDSGMRYSLGICLARSGRLVDAIPHLSEAVRLLPESDAMRVSLGMALAASGDRQSAAMQFEEALRLKPGNQDARAGLQALGISDARRR